MLLANATDPATPVEVLQPETLLIAGFVKKHGRRGYNISAGRYFPRAIIFAITVPVIGVDKVGEKAKPIDTKRCSLEEIKEGVDDNLRSSRTIAGALLLGHVSAVGVGVVPCDKYLRHAGLVALNSASLSKFVGLASKAAEDWVKAQPGPSPKFRCFRWVSIASSPPPMVVGTPIGHRPMLVKSRLRR